MKVRLLVLAIVVASVPRAQSAPPQSPALPDLKGIVDAEAEGQRFQRATSPVDKDLGGVADTGTAERRCADVGSSKTVRSGEFVAGNFAAYPMFYREGTGKIWWATAHWPELQPSGWPAKGAMPLTVRVTRLDTIAPGQVYTYGTWAKPAGQKGDLFVPSDLRLPTPGQWMLVATAGPNWGCFVYDLRG